MFQSSREQVQFLSFFVPCFFQIGQFALVSVRIDHYHIMHSCMAQVDRMKSSHTLISQGPTFKRIVEQTVDVSVSQIRKQCVEVAKVISHERLQQRTAEQIAAMRLAPQHQVPVVPEADVPRRGRGERGEDRGQELLGDILRCCAQHPH